MPRRGVVLLVERVESYSVEEGERLGEEGGGYYD